MGVTGDFPSGTWKMSKAKADVAVRLTRARPLERVMEAIKAIRGQLAGGNAAEWPQRST